MEALHADRGDRDVQGFLASAHGKLCLLIGSAGDRNTRFG